ncbi:MAG: type II toxin-antitoxin system VapC family toxin [Deltaproteobacteria bacterium]|nr:type II toxin-antitoxin system VapC family toxin [Deltaproteobacteria bacterium]
MKWVVDASVAIRWFLEDEVHPNADAVLAKVVDAPALFAVPELLAFEVFSVLERLHPAGLGAFQRGMVSLLQGGVFRQPMTEKLAKGADRFVKLGLTGHDACYAALARDLKAVWLTFDLRAHELIDGGGNLIVAPK